MKKIFFYSFFTLLCIHRLSAQDAVAFKIKYLPDHTYDMGATTAFNFNINFKGNQQMLDMLTKQGITQPMAVTGNIDKSFTIKTGAGQADQSFPLVINSNGGKTNITINGKEIPALQNMNLANTNRTVYAHVDGQGHFEMDSIAGTPMAAKAMPDSNRKKISQMMNAFQNMVKFPDHPLKVGDSFTQRTPINLPTGGNNMNVDVEITYKLTRIENGNAYFDLDERLDVNLSVKKATIKLSGTGRGKMVYVINENFPSFQNSAIDMKIDVQADTAQINGTGTVTSGNKITFN
jgi:hypothetical protein